MSTSAQYASTVRAATVTLPATANTGRDGSGTITSIFTAGASGSRIDDIYITAINNTTAGTFRLFIHNGTASFLWLEIPVSAITVSGTQQAWSYSLLNQGLVLPSGYSLRAAPQTTDIFTVIVTRAGDF